MERRTLLRSLSYARNLLLQPSNNITSASASISTLTAQSLLGRCFSLPSQSVAISPHCASPGALSVQMLSDFPVVTDPDVKNVFKDLMTASWDELPDAVLHDAKVALSKTNEDKAGQEALANIFRAAEAVEKFAGILVSLRMELDDSIGLSVEKVGHMAGDLQDASHAAYNCYMTYLMHLALRRYICVRKLKWSWGQR